ncbi:hypothetical protein [Acinetobacter wuhouensis]|uniref:Carbon storage regulator n=1 Tax=Acinetobacter wuhouensis TaxID=1879050 RepID=A0A3G2T330_9GAMM|nr:hypothetical protein [Acinetobacter wuhouensis]AYO54395.1 hypothetical protein CDG68_12440 [Acinetobacter wuhouensis]
MGKLNVDLKVGETLRVGESIIQLENKSGKVARLTITADNSINIEHLRMSASDLNQEKQTHGKHTL